MSALPPASRRLVTPLWALPLLAVTGLMIGAASMWLVPAEDQILVAVTTLVAAAVMAAVASVPTSEPRPVAVGHGGVLGVLAFAIVCVAAPPPMAGAAVLLQVACMGFATRKSRRISWMYLTWPLLAVVVAWALQGPWQGPPLTTPVATQDTQVVGAVTVTLVTAGIALACADLLANLNVTVHRSRDRWNALANEVGALSVVAALGFLSLAAVAGKLGPVSAVPMFAALLLAVTGYEMGRVRALRRARQRDDSRMRLLEESLAAASRRQDAGQDALVGQLHDGPLQDVIAAATLIDVAAETQDWSLAAEARGMMLQSIDSTRNILAGEVEADRTPPQTLGEAVMRLSMACPPGGGTQVTFRIDEDVAAVLSEEQAKCVLLVAREALANACKHARARKVKVQLGRGPRGAVVLRVTDDGIGLPGGFVDVRHAAQAGHMGVALMARRAAATGGVLDIAERSLAGTEVTLTFPRCADGD